MTQSEEESASVQAVRRSRIEFCPKCGRLMAEEPGPLCDECSPVPYPADAAAQPGTPVTWALIAVTAVASLVGIAFSHEEFPLGANFGPSVAGGQWWRLVSAVFVHYSFGHFCWNMIPLWFFGRRLERILGHWTFIAFYLACGVAGSIVSLVVSPEQASAGASGAIFGVCGGLFILYALRLRTLSRNQRIKLVLLGMYLWTAIWDGFANDHTDNSAHFAGLAAGIVLGLILSLGLARRAIFRGGIFLAIGVVLVLAAWSFRQSHLYLVHLDAAARALQNGQTDVAVRELHSAQEMKADSPIAHFLKEKLAQNLDQSPEP